MMGFALSSHAAIVTQWSATVSDTWIPGSFATGVTLSNSNQTLSWGEPDGFGQSSLTLTSPPANETVTTYVGGGTPPPESTAAGGTLTHHNVPIFNSPMTGATLNSTLNLTALAPPSAGPGTLSPINFNIAFLETPNVAGQCPAASPPNNPCNDIFVLLNGFFNQTFTYLGSSYFVNIFPTSGGVLSILEPSACAAVHAVNSAAPATGCFGFTTPEDATTTLTFGFTISTLPLSVPEPGTIALVGLALLGLAVARRRIQVR
ncbi:hypothetical protein B0E49_07890 [Polaromonas sp. C04]|nr:hypothetical protein B0E49_07890 [Polaromonas sp. C04]